MDLDSAQITGLNHFLHAYAIAGLLEQQSPGQIPEWVFKFEVIPLCLRGRCVGACLRKGPELHFGVLAEAHGCWLTRQALQETINLTIHEYGYACTKVTPGQSTRFIRRLGAKFWKNDGTQDWYWLTEPVCQMSRE